MVAISHMRLMYVVVLCIGVILGIVALSVDTTVQNVKTTKQGVYVAFNIIGVIFLIASLVLMLLLLFACGDQYKPFMLSIIVCTVIAMICYAISVGVYSSMFWLEPISWMLSALWINAVAVIIAIVFLLTNPESI